MEKGNIKKLGRSATDTLNLVIAGSAAVAAAALHSWPVLAIGGVTYAALIGWDLVKKANKKVAVIEDQEAQKMQSRILTAHIELKRALAETPTDIASMLISTSGGIDELMRQSSELIEHVNDIALHVMKYDVRALEKEVERLSSQIAGTKDEETRDSYQKTRDARSEQLSALSELLQAKERAFAQLGRSLATLEALPAKIVRMRVLDREAQDRVSGDLNAEIERVNSDVRSFEETIRVLVEPL